MIHPMQEIILDKHGTPRFKENKIVSLLLKTGIHDMNTIYCMDFSDEDRSQFAQLIGYSVSGFGELSYAKSVGAADNRANKLLSAPKEPE